MNKNQILETIKMLEEEKLDVRTVTMGISLLDCIPDNPKTVVKKGAEIGRASCRERV